LLDEYRVGVVRRKWQGFWCADVGSFSPYKISLITGEEWNIGRINARVKVKDHHVDVGMVGGIYGKDSFEFNDERIDIQATGVGVGKIRIEYYRRLDG